jgi:dTDP-4-amino-4,6-dideoxygalactose transaminase
MELLTKVNSTPSQNNINYQDTILLLGSCFADNIGAKFSQYYFPTTINPFGTLYNPASILEAIQLLNAEGRPIWKPMHMQPIYRTNAFVTASGNGRARSNAYITETGAVDVGADIFERGLCLPSDNKMTAEQQKTIIEVVCKCFK